MTEKRYAIVKIQEHFCSAHQIVNEGDTIYECEINKSCRYGDTKEQFTRKIETAIEIAINRYEQGLIVGKNKNRQCAEIIVEFLGVE